MPELLVDMISTSTIYIAKNERNFGWKLYLVCDSTGIPICFVVRPARLHDTTVVDDLA